MTERLLARGERVVAMALREYSLANLQRKHGDSLVARVLDLTDTAECLLRLSAFEHRSVWLRASDRSCSSIIAAYPSPYLCDGTAFIDHSAHHRSRCLPP